MSGQVLIVDSSETRCNALASSLRSGFLTADVTDDFAAVPALATKTDPCLILIDCEGADDCGLRLCEALKADPDLQSIPVILTVDADDATRRLAGLQAGADDLLISPFQPRVLLARVRSLMRIKAMRDELVLRQATARELGLQEDIDDPDDSNQTLFASANLPKATKVTEHFPATRSKILLVNSDRQAAEALRKRLDDQLDVEFTIATTGFAALRATETQSLDAIMVSEAPAMAHGFSEVEDPVQLIAAISSRTDARHAPILFLTSEPLGSARFAPALDAGASDCASLNDPSGELATRLAAQLKRKRYSDHLRARLDDGLRLAVTDGLTGLPGRRYLNQHLERLFARARRDGRPLSALMFDLDRFKAINDQYGHDAGDIALAEFAKRLKAEVRGGDLVARYGGEEFLVITTDATHNSAYSVAERVRCAVAEVPIEIAGGDQIVLTVSIGVASISPEDHTPSDLISRADKALGEAKRKGRNRICFTAA